MVPVFGTEDGPRMGDVAQRPETLIGEAEIEAFLLFFAEPDAPQRVLRMIGRHTQPSGLVGALAVRIAGSLRDPGSVTRPQHRLERCNQAARWHRPCDRTPLTDVLVRFPV